MTQRVSRAERRRRQKELSAVPISLPKEKVEQLLAALADVQQLIDGIAHKLKGH